MGRERGREEGGFFLFEGGESEVVVVEGDQKEGDSNENSMLAFSRPVLSFELLFLALFLCCSRQNAMSRARAAGQKKMTKQKKRERKSMVLSFLDGKKKKKKKKKKPAPIASSSSFPHLRRKVHRGPSPSISPSSHIERPVRLLLLLMMVRSSSGLRRIVSRGGRSSSSRVITAFAARPPN